MLVLSRKKNESIVLGDAIVIHVAEVRGNRVRLAIDATQNIPVIRSELFSASESLSKNVTHNLVDIESGSGGPVNDSSNCTVIRSVAIAPFRAAPPIAGPHPTAVRRRRPR